MYAHWVLLVVLLACSGLVSGSETALFGLSRVELRAFVTSGGPLKRQAWQLRQRPRRLLMTVLIANTTINVLFFAISFVLLERLGRQSPVAASVGGVAALLAVILCGEILPKAAARAHAARVAPLVAPVIRTAQTALGPLQTVLQVALVEPLTRLLQSSQAATDEVTVDELRVLVETSAHQGVIDSAENRMLQEIVALPETKVRSIMQPRVELVAAGLDEDPGDVLAKMQQARVTRIPVCGRGLDDIRGLIHIRDLYLSESGTPVAQLVRPARFVPEQAHLLQLIEHFRNTQSQLAVVVDEHGGTAGLVSLRDVLEEIVGDLGGGDGPTEPVTEVIDENTYRLAGDLNIRDWAERFAVVGLPSAGRFDTVAGLVLSKLGRLPRVGDAVRIHNLTLTVERLEGRRIERILLTRHRPGSPGSPGPAPSRSAKG
jgi:CBS domain containing-hemolysin-like protein